MALPTFVGVGTAKADTLPVTNVPWPAGHQAGDFGFLVIETAAQAPGNNPPAGWTAVPTVSPQSTGTAGAAGATALYVYSRYATSNSEASADIGDSGDHQLAYIVAFRGVDPSAAIDVAAGAVAASSTSFSFPSVTTTGTDRLIVLIGTNAVDTATTQLSAVANAALANIANRKNQQSGTGVGGGLAVYTGEKATAGATGATTGTLATASVQAAITIALKPPGAGTGPFGGFYVATGVKQTAGATGTSTGNLQTAQKQVRMIIALKPPVVVTNLPPVLDAFPNLAATVGDELDFQLTATDPEGGALTWSINPNTTLVPSSLTIDSTGLIRWTPLFVHQGIWNLKARVTDVGGLFDEQVFTITVTGGPASALDIANRATTDFEAAKDLVNLVLQAEQMNAIMIDKAKILAADLGLSKAFMDETIADLEAQNP